MQAPRARLLRHESAAGSWELAVRAPAPALRDQVRGDYVGYVESTPGLVQRREFAAPFTVVIFELGPPLRLRDPDDAGGGSRHAAGFVAGISDHATLTEHDGRASGIQVDLTPLGARLLCDAPICELAGRIVAVDDLLPREHRRFSERLAEAPDWDARFTLLDQLLQERRASARACPRKIAWALARIEAAGGQLDIGDLARELGHSPKYLIAQFREHIGLAPKLTAQLVRFDRVVHHIRRGGRERWAELAQRFGYFDQAHLVRDFRRFTGLTPTAARASLSPWPVDP
jgi:AraC-like DNA-binding protein